MIKLCVGLGTHIVILQYNFILTSLAHIQHGFQHLPSLVVYIFIVQPPRGKLSTPKKISGLKSLRMRNLNSEEPEESGEDRV